MCFHNGTFRSQSIPKPLKYKYKTYKHIQGVLKESNLKKKSQPNFPIDMTWERFILVLVRKNQKTFSRQTAAGD